LAQVVQAQQVPPAFEVVMGLIQFFQQLPQLVVVVVVVST
jgi:hypothetical protein